MELSSPAGPRAATPKTWSSIERPGKTTSVTLPRSRLVLPVGGPGLPPEQPIALGSGGGGPAQGGVVARGTAAELRAALLVHHRRRRRGQGEDREGRGVHPGVPRQVGRRDAVQGVLGGVLAGVVLLRLGEANPGKAPGS